VVTRICRLLRPVQYVSGDKLRKENGRDVVCGAFRVDENVSIGVGVRAAVVAHPEKVALSHKQNTSHIMIVSSSTLFSWPGHRVSSIVRFLDRALLFSQRWICQETLDGFRLIHSGYGFKPLHGEHHGERDVHHIVAQLPGEASAQSRAYRSR